MIHFLRASIVATIVAAAGANAAPLTPDPTGSWHDPAELGWGASIVQQDEALFVVLFVYDDQKRPTWFVASNVRDTGVELDPIGSRVFSGTLYQTSGAPFAAPFDPNAVGVQTVGSLSVAYVPGPNGQSALSFVYTVNGRLVNKVLQRLTWASNEQLLFGNYLGGISVGAPFAASGFACPSDLGELFRFGDLLRVVVPSPGNLFIYRTNGIDTITAISGPYIQDGQLGALSGSVFSGSIAAPLPVASAQLTNISATSTGFSGNIRIVQGNCTYVGTVGGIRMP